MARTFRRVISWAACRTESVFWTVYTSVREPTMSRIRFIRPPRRADFKDPPGLVYPWEGDQPKGQERERAALR